MPHIAHNFFCTENNKIKMVLNEHPDTDTKWLLANTIGS